MVELKTRVIGAEAVKADLENLGQTVVDEIKVAVEETSAQMLNIAHQNVSGGVLKVGKSGKLSSSLGQTLRQTKTAVYGKVGTDWYIGRFWERGFNGQQDVKAHYRSLKHGKPTKIVRKTRSGKLRTVKKFATGVTLVTAYIRLTDGRPRPWLRPALEAVRASFRARVQDAIARTTQK